MFKIIIYFILSVFFMRTLEVALLRVIARYFPQALIYADTYPPQTNAAGTTSITNLDRSRHEAPPPKMEPIFNFLYHTHSDFHLATPL